jgi:hypothetical protein
MALQSFSAYLALAVFLRRGSGYGSGYGSGTTHLIRKKTTIPVPQIHTRGLVETNPLGLSPFILVEFIEGIYLKDLFLRALTWKARNVV